MIAEERKKKASPSETSLSILRELSSPSGLSTERMALEEGRASSWAPSSTAMNAAAPLPVRGPGTGLRRLFYCLYFLYVCTVTPVISQESAQFFSSRPLFSLKSYKDVQLFRYHVPNDVAVAHWTLWSNGTKGCDPNPVSVYLRWKGYPLLNINNATIGGDYLFSESQQYEIQLESDSKLITFNQSSPLPGDWFGLGFISQTDDRIVQKGLFRRCQTWLTSTLSFTRLPQEPILLATVTPVHQKLSGPKYFKFYLPVHVFSAKVNLTKCSASRVEGSGQSCPLTISFRGMALPDESNFADVFDCSQKYSEDMCLFEDLKIAKGGWNYLLIEPTLENTLVEFELLVATGECLAPASTRAGGLSVPVYRQHTVAPPSTTTKYPYYSLNQNHSTTPMPLSFPSPSTSPSPLPPYVSSHMVLPSPSHVRHGSRHVLEETAPVNVCPYHVKLMRYNLLGNFAFKYDYMNGLGVFNFSGPPQPFLTIPNSQPNLTRLSMIDFEVTPLVDAGGTVVIDLGISPYSNTTYHNISVQLCLEHGFFATSFRNCSKSIQVNTSYPESVLRSLYVPFPRSGHWFITLKAECYFHEREPKEQETSPVPCEFNSSSILLNVKSASCVDGKCGKHGKCNHYISGGIIFSTCACKSKWKGWTCDDGSQVDAEDQLVFNFFLLVLSNLVFIPSVILATCRKHYVEAMVYLTTMASSGLYHACDSQSEQAFCVLNLNILQFGDFYSALLSFWVTFISLANLPEKGKAFLHTVGGIFIAFAVEYDRTSLWAFAVPCGIGAAVVLFTWIYHCSARRTCYPTGKHWAFSIIPGLVLAGGGLVVYALFETQDNYAITHSCWHAIMAVALLFLIPSIRRDPVEEEDEFRGKVSMQNAKLAHVEWRPNTSFKFLQDDIDML